MQNFARKIEWVPQTDIQLDGLTDADSQKDIYSKMSYTRMTYHNIMVKIRWSSAMFLRWSNIPGLKRIKSSSFRHKFRKCIYSHYLQLSKILYGVLYHRVAELCVNWCFEFSISRKKMFKVYNETEAYHGCKQEIYLWKIR